MNGNVLSAAAVLGGNMPKASSPCDAAVEAINSRLHTIREGLSGLNATFAPVLRTEPPALPTAGPTAVREAGESPLHDELLSIADNLDDLYARVHSLARRATT